MAGRLALRGARPTNETGTYLKSVAATVTDHHNDRMAALDYQRTIIGYHGCDRETAERVLLGRNRLSPIENNARLRRAQLGDSLRRG
jgi:hypothetical protein